MVVQVSLSTSIVMLPDLNDLNISDSEVYNLGKSDTITIHFNSVVVILICSDSNALSHILGAVIRVCCCIFGLHSCVSILLTDHNVT